jgi:hypothetical protein
MLVEYFADYIAKGYELTAAETVIRTTVGSGPYWTPSDRMYLHDAFGGEDAAWTAPLLGALIVHITAGMVMDWPRHPDEEFVVAYASNVLDIPGMDPHRVHALHEAAQARVGGEARTFDMPGQWLSTAAALAGFWVLEPEAGPERYRGRELTTQEAIERARPVVDYFYDQAITPAAVAWVFAGGPWDA